MRKKRDTELRISKGIKIDQIQTDMETERKKRVKMTEEEGAETDLNTITITLILINPCLNKRLLLKPKRNKKNKKRKWKRKSKKNKKNQHPNKQ